MAAQVIDLGDVRFARRVQRLHALGPRPLFEMLCELGARRLLRQPIEELVDKYSGNDPEMLAATGGDRLSLDWPRGVPEP
jgi:hypothetical protein